jgi:AcrR family transcriptional regulator
MGFDGPTRAINSRRMSKTPLRQRKSAATGSIGLSDAGRSRQIVHNHRASVPSGANRPDRRVLRTQRALREALLHLVRERGWDRVSVQDVCDRADVGRSTFYLHFADREELLVSGFGDLRQTLRTHLAPADGEPLGFTMALIEHAREFREIYKALVGRRTGRLVQQSFMDVLKDLVAEDLVRGASSAVPDIAVSYVAGAFWEVLSWWFEQRKPLPAVEVAAAFKQLTLPLLPVIRHPALREAKQRA